MKFNSTMIMVCLLMIGGPCFALAPESLWVWTYGGSANGSDWAMGCCTNNAGSVYVTGMVFNGSNDDIYGFRINSSTGVTQGFVPYNSPYNGMDWGLGGARDNVNNYTYICGLSMGSANMDYILLKLSDASPETTWTRRYNSPYNSDDAGMACALDGQNYLYLTGDSKTPVSHDIVTVKYNVLTGDTIWTRRYNGPANRIDQGTGCAVDASHNFFVVGPSSNGSTLDLLTIKYTSNGDTIWTRRYNTGIDTTMIQYVFDGCAVDAAGNVYVSGSMMNGTYFDALTIKYTSTGDAAWIRPFGISGLTESAFANCLSPAGDALYVTGLITAAASDDAVLTIKYNTTTGDTVWTARYNANVNGFECGQGCATDNAGYLYVSGVTTNASGNGDWLLLKYNTVTGVAEAVGREQNPGVKMTAVPNPFFTCARIPGHENDDFTILDVSGRKIEECKGSRIGERLPKGVYFVKPANGNADAVRVVKID